MQVLRALHLAAGAPTVIFGLCQNFCARVTEKFLIASFIRRTNVLTGGIPYHDKNNSSKL